ncbi:MAG TPA: polysaccharide deacetylase family protein [Myxococcota bacterium]|nr:polysaccharide deacetylase family protein [Myxococcota bacterium]
MTKPIASLSLDLDNQWSYMKTHGDPGWESFPSYLDIVVPRFLEILAALNLRITVFVVGQDAALEKNRSALSRLAPAGHEIGNHSFHHEPWLHLYSEPRLVDELTRAEDAIEAATGHRPNGFRGPGFSLSETTLRVLAQRGYRYDASTLPTFLGPLARAYYFMTARLTPDEREERRKLFGGFAEGLRPVRPYRWNMGDATLLEIPVTTVPLLRIPMHVSYILYAATVSPTLARAYFSTALRLCRWTGVAPSILLHPLDFLGGDDVCELSFFPAMGMPGRRKLELVSELLTEFASRFDVVPMGAHAEALLRSSPPLRQPRFPARTETV